MTKNISRYQKAIELKKRGYTHEQIAPMLGYKAKSSVTKLLARGGAVKSAKNSFFPAPDGTGGISKDPSQQWGANNPKNLNTFIAPLQFARIKAGYTLLAPSHTGNRTGVFSAPRENAARVH